MPTCWESTPEKCTGCHYCRTARDLDAPVYPLSPLEAHRLDLVDAELAAAMRLPLDKSVVDAALARQYGEDRSDA